MNRAFTHLYQREFVNKYTLFGEKRVIFEVVDSIRERMLENGTEVLIDTNGEECKLEDIKHQLEEHTDRELLSCRNNSSFNILQEKFKLSSEFDNIPDIPEEVEDDEGEKKPKGNAHNNIYTKDAYHAESEKGYIYN